MAGWIVFLLVVAMVTYVLGTAPVDSIVMKVVNHAGAPIELYWINTFTPARELVKQTQKPIRNSSETVINSYDTHEFMVKYLDPKREGSVSFAKGPREEVVTIGLDENNQLTVVQTTKFDELVDTINSLANQCPRNNQDELSSCIANGIMSDFNKQTESKARLAKYRDAIAYRLRNYTCADSTMKTTEPIKSYDVRIDGKNHKVNILLDMDHAKIWYVDNFITQDECNVLIKHGKPLLRRATVAAEDGSSVVSENRKAQQASYNFQDRPSADPLWPLFNRVLSLTNHHAGFELQPPGQEDFTIIQYNVDDQYTPHCDGQCDATPHHSGGRVATAVLYCKVAERGGGTTFTKADVFVQPKVGMATFFSYKGPDGIMDEGYTEHSGCPVLEGEKWITTVWMREGVSEEEPWTLFDPSGIRLMSETDDPEPVAEESHDEL